jgi:asparagine synthase (glutamine-hydrolysing)
MDEYTEQMMLIDTLTYLPDDIMVKVDRASMAYSLEARAPLMDYRIMEFAASLPLSFKLEGPRGKRILRDVLYRYVPRELVDRPKIGFGVPIDSWLRGPLRDWAETLLATRNIDGSGVFRSEPVRKAWAEHLSGTQQRQYLLWDVLMFESWLNTWKENRLKKNVA